MQFCAGQGLVTGSLLSPGGFKLTIIKAILIVIAAVLLACVGIVGYAFILTRRRPPLALYESRSPFPS